jgi:hypothetical protein
MTATKNKKEDKMRYYVIRENEIGQRTVISDNQGRPVDMAGVDIIDLPNGDYLTVVSRGKEYPAYKIALAIATGQIKIDDVKEA